MSKSCRHQTRDDRSKIYVHKSNGLSNKDFAEEFGVHRRTIERDIKRNSGKHGYRFHQADAMTVKRCSTGPSFIQKIGTFAVGEYCEVPVRSMESGAD